MSLPVVRIRDLKSGQTLTLTGAQTSVEILDDQANVALLLLPDAVVNGMKIVTANEEADVARDYAATHGIRFSTLRTPDLRRLKAE